MSFLDSPIARCDAAHTMVLTDQTQRQCGLEHACPAGRVCPLDGCFATHSGLSETVLPAPSKARRARRGLSG